MKSFRLGVMLALGASLLSIAPAAMAAPAFSVSGTPTSLDNPPFTLGYAFTLSQSFDLTALGVFDEDGDGLLNSYDIGLFDNSGTLLASTTLGAGTIGTLIDGYRYASFDALSLGAGDYRIGAYYTNADGQDGLYFADDGNTVSSIAGVSFQGARYAFGDALADPTTDYGTGGFFGPNLLLATSAVPEPAAWALMIGGFGLAGGSMRRRKPTISVAYA